MIQSHVDAKGTDRFFMLSVSERPSSLGDTRRLGGIATGTAEFAPTSDYYPQFAVITLFPALPVPDYLLGPWMLLCLLRAWQCRSHSSLGAHCQPMQGYVRVPLFAEEVRRTTSGEVIIPTAVLTPLDLPPLSHLPCRQSLTYY